MKKRKSFIAYNVVGCSRCGENHPKMKARYFGRPPAGGWDSWAVCPRTGEPVLLDTAGAPPGDKRPFLYRGPA